jgi:type III secretion protein T
MLLDNPGRLVGLFLLTLCRLVPIISIAPFFGQKLMPQVARMAFAVCLSVIFFPHLLLNTSPDLGWNTALMGYALKEVAVGAVMGFLISMPFNIAQMAGSVIDTQRGSSSMVGSDPIMGTQSSTIGSLYNFLTITMFFTLDGPNLFIDAIYKSYNVIHPDQTFPVSFFKNTSGVYWTYMIGLMAKIFALSVQLAAPSLVAILMADIFLGIVGRLAPQIQISFLGMGLKAYSSDIAMWAAWLFIIEQLGVMSIGFIKNITDILDHIKM